MPTYILPYVQDSLPVISTQEIFLQEFPKCSLHNLIKKSDAIYAIGPYTMLYWVTRRRKVNKSIVCSFAVSNSRCSAELGCICTEGFALVPDQKICVPRTIGEQSHNGTTVASCTTDEQCDEGVKNSYCGSGVCICKTGFTVNTATYEECMQK